MTSQPDQPPALRILSLGAGVQSTTLLLLAAEGRLPKLDAAVFADTGWEPAAAEETREIVHGCPPDGSGLTPCCGRTPFELPLSDRISSEAPVTCPGTAPVSA